MIKRLLWFSLLICSSRGLPQQSAFCTTGAGTQLSGVTDSSVMSRKSSSMDSASASTTTKDGIMVSEGAAPRRGLEGTPA